MLSPDYQAVRQHPTNLRIHQQDTAPTDLYVEILRGLEKPQKQLPPKLFYDEQGSRLFDAITQLPEYYLTRTEQKIFLDHLPEIRALMGNAEVLIEPGCGSCEKARRLLDQSRLKSFVPIEISANYLLSVACDLAQDYPGIQIEAICGDFTRINSLPDSLPQGRRRMFFPGSTIGNFEPAAAKRLLRSFHHWLGPEGGLLIGVDTKKDETLLNAAYNDQQGITAAFNLNMLSHINWLTGSDLRPEYFSHHAFYNASCGRVEMHLRSLTDQVVRIGGKSFQFRAGETIHTESSYKYAPDEFAALSEEAGFIQKHCWQDPEGNFSLHYLAT